MAAAANDPGERGGSRAARWLLAPPSCGASLRLPLSLPGSFASLATMTRTDASRARRSLPQRRGGGSGVASVIDLHGSEPDRLSPLFVAWVLPELSPAVAVVAAGAVGEELLDRVVVHGAPQRLIRLAVPELAEGATV